MNRIIKKSFPYYIAGFIFLTIFSVSAYKINKYLPIAMVTFLVGNSLIEAGSKEIVKIQKEDGMEKVFELIKNNEDKDK